MEFTPSPSSIFQNKKIKYNNKKPTKNGIIWINFSKIRKARCTLTPLSLRSARLTQYMRFARCTSLSHILLHSVPQNIAYTETLYAILFLLIEKRSASCLRNTPALALSNTPPWSPYLMRKTAFPCFRSTETSSKKSSATPRKTLPVSTV